MLLQASLCVQKAKDKKYILAFVSRLFFVRENIEEKAADLLFDLHSQPYPDHELWAVTKRMTS